MNWSVLRRILHVVFLTGICLLAIAYWLRMRGGRDSTPPIPVLGAVPDFTLTERSGQPLKRADLRGKVWIADFVFTHCAGPCPLMTAQMARLQRLLMDTAEVRFVSFSVDPDRDTPVVLTDYAKKFSAEPGRWFFLTGDKTVIFDLANKGFRIVATENKGEQAQPDEGPILHSTKFVLVDRSGNIRGYYDGLETGGLERLLRDVNTVLQEKSRR